MVKGGIVYSASLPWTLDVASASGDEIVTRSGQRLIDFTSGWNVASLGWNPPALVHAATEHLTRQACSPIWTSSPSQLALAQTLADALPGELSVVGRATGGTEANEEAIKTARAFTGRHHVLGFVNTYHGQSLATLAIGTPAGAMTALGSLPGGFSQLEFPARSVSGDDAVVLAQFEERLDEVLATGSIAAVVAEPGIVTGTGCVRIAPTGFLRALRELTRRHGALLVFDEVGTGFSRCGWLFGMLQEDVVPDIVTLGKGITNGVIPLGAMVTTPEIAEATSDLTELTSTFGWTPAACGVAMECVSIHRRERVWEKAAADGQRLLSRLRAELSGQLAVAWIRGLGMEIGIGFHDACSDSDLSVARRIVGRSLERGLHVVGDGANSLQLMPPLTISAESLERGTGILLDVIREVA